MNVFFLEKKETMLMPNILGNSDRPAPMYHWKAIYTCPERWPLELILRHLDRQNYKITERTGRR